MSEILYNTLVINNTDKPTKKRKQGFNVMKQEDIKRIASSGGRRGKGHKFTSDEAREAIRKRTIKNSAEQKPAE